MCKYYTPKFSENKYEASALLDALIIFVWIYFFYGLWVLTKLQNTIFSPILTADSHNSDWQSLTVASNSLQTTLLHTAMTGFIRVLMSIKALVLFQDWLQNQIRTFPLLSLFPTHSPVTSICECKQVVVSCHVIWTFFTAKASTWRCRKKQLKLFVWNCVSWLWVNCFQ